MFVKVGFPSLPVTYFASGSLLEWFLLLDTTFVLTQSKSGMESFLTFITTWHNYNNTKFNQLKCYKLALKSLIVLFGKL